MPVVFVSHGSPDSLLNAPAVLDCWADIGRDLPAPRAILAVSAHWEARVPCASLAWLIRNKTACRADPDP